VSIQDHVVLSVTATDPNASEQGLDPGTFVFERSGSTTDELAFIVSLSGTASSGADYVNLGSSNIVVVIPAGASTTTRTVTPLADNLAEGPETVTFTLRPSPNYSIAPLGTATVTIADDPAVVTVVATDPAASEAGERKR
jgi:hypothetical protein